MEEPIYMPHFASCSQEEFGCDYGYEVIWIAMDRQVHIMLKALQPFQKVTFIKA